MRIDVISIFPETFDAVTNYGITSRAMTRDLWSLHRWNPRDFTTDTYRRIDDRPYGGGPGMVMLATPLERTLNAIQDEQRQQLGRKGPVILMSPQGEPLTHRRVTDLVPLPAMTILAGRYEAVDQRFIDKHVDEQICIGDFVVSGGELPAMMLIDALARLIPGSLDEEATAQESFAQGLLDCPHYTRPEQLDGVQVPPVLLSGNHAEIQRWRRRQALILTARRRPELITVERLAGRLTREDEAWLSEVVDGPKGVGAS